MSATRGGSYYARKRRVLGDRAFKKLLIRMPSAIREEIVRMLEETGRSILAAQRADAPSRTGAVRRALSMRVLPGALQLKVGLLGRPLNRRLFYARIVEKGRKAQVSAAARMSRSGVIERYNVRVRAKAGRPFIYSARAEAGRIQGGGAVRQFWENVLTSAAQGATDD